ncbi:nitrilase-related carbon-nitrogen hydrolase [Kaarinaea lacus]
MAQRSRFVIAQLNFMVGDVAGNTRKVIESAIKARDELDAQAIVYPELTLTGYPPEDLLLREGLHRNVEKALSDICSQVTGIDIILGYPRKTGNHIYNVAGLIRDGEIIEEYRKRELPNYGVFDEKRYFTEGRESSVVSIAGIPVGLTVCEDVWFPGPIASARDAGAKLIVNLNASPYSIHKDKERLEQLNRRVDESGLPILYANLVGGQDELIFDGHSMVMSADGSLCVRAPAFEEGLFVADIDLTDDGSASPVSGEVTENYEEVETLFCDSSGFGSEREPALTKEQATARANDLVEQHGKLFSGLTGIGQFQVYVTLYKEVG